VLNTHLGLVPHEQRAQALALAGPDWTGKRRRSDPPLIVLGDFNATPQAQAYRTLAARFTDARVQSPGPGRTPTFPSRLPVLAIDHVFLDGKVRATRVQTVSGALARIASDHLPLVVDFDLD
jgi:endonuclease/exonuclease/phosphatase family metal-dependent hydrolase